MTGHTRGPWVTGWGNGITGSRAAASCYWDETEVEELVVRAGDRAVCFVASLDPADDLMPDARLIAAAPELLEVLKRIDAHGYTTGADYDMVRAVIAKATGAAE